MFYKTLSILCIMTFCTSSFVSAADSSKKKSSKKEEADVGYAKPKHVSDAEWAAVKPYLLPASHSLKNKLDRLFSKTRVIKNSETIKSAGFAQAEVRRWSHTVVTKHPKFKKYFFKLFTDEQTTIDGCKYLVKRAFGAASARKTIEKYGLGKFFVVPKKWIYVLPENPAPAASANRKNFILVAERIDILSSHQNFSRWKSSKVKPKLLDALYLLMKEEGLKDSIYPFNVPFTPSGKIALIDLEHNHEWPVAFSVFEKFLSSEMKIYWMTLVNKK